MSFPPAFLEELRSRLPLSEVAGRRVKLVRAGREYKACCPFHNEKTPSFTLNDAKGFFHCFGCGAHGDIIGFVMQHDRLSFVEAIEHLAGQAGLDVPRLSPEQVEKAKQQKTLHQLCESACVWFEQQLRQARGRTALDYLKGRGLSDSAISRFRLGYAPQDGVALVQHLKAEGHEPEQMIEVGLVRRSEEGDRLYSFFRDRVMFPVTDRRGRVVAFGGRILSGDGPKYINSPDHPLFHKGRLLYSLARAREAAPRGAVVIVVEGYMDVIALVEAGFGAAVAPLGTALTEEQIEELWKLGGTAGDPVLCFDGDAAGQRAAARAVDRLLPKLGPGRSVRFAFLPEGQDPDDLLKQAGVSAMQAVVKASIPLIDMIWRLETASLPQTPESRAGVKKALENRISFISDVTVKTYYQAEIRQRLDEAYGWARPLRERNSRNFKAVSPVTKPPLPDVKAVHQRRILLGLLRQPGVFEEMGEQIVGLGVRGPLDKLWQAVVTTLENQPGLDSAGLETYLREQGFADILPKLLSDRTDAGHWIRPGASEDEVRQGVAEIVNLHRKQALRADLQAAERRLAGEMSEAALRHVAAVRDEFVATEAAVVLSGENEKAG